MRTVVTREDLRATLGAWRRSGEGIALVPTMGNLHAGHRSLVELAGARRPRVVVSSFVNPTQFGPNEDYAAYPRTPDADRAALHDLGVDLLFEPEVATMYPGGTEGSVRIEVPGLSDILCGRTRPGHFSGVATVVAKLFNLVQPDLAVFGQKDYQQTLVIRRLVRDVSFPIELVIGATLREPSGLALSSRNQYLTAGERVQAAAIHATLQDMAGQVRLGEDEAVVCEAGTARLAAAGLRVDYCTVRMADDLSEPQPGQQGPRVALAAAYLGRARLIDNVLI